MSDHYEGFTYQGERISDIEAWARERKEMLIHYRKTSETYSRVTGKIEREITEGVMPQSFWNTLKYGCNDIGAFNTFEKLGMRVPTPAPNKTTDSPTE